MSISKADGSIVRVNSAMTTLLGYSEQEMLKSPYLTFVHPEDIHKTSLEAQRLSRGEEIFAFENRYICKNGEVVWLSWRCRPRDNFIYAVARDLTQWKKDQAHLARLLEAEARQTIAQSRAIVESSGDAIIGTDLDGIVTSWNRAAETMFGYASEEMLGASIQKIFPQNRQEAEQLILHKIKNLENIHHYEAQRIDKNGKMLSVSLSVSPIRDRDGKPIGVAKIVRDITREKQNAEERAGLVIAEQSARESSRLKSEFLANMSHEIRTPLNGIVGTANLLLETKLSARQRDFAETIVQSSDHLLSIVNDILDLSKIEANKVELQLVPIDLRDLLYNVKRVMNHAANTKSLKFEFELEDTYGDLLKGDYGRIRQILVNLISNAIKFTDQGQVLVKARRLRFSDETDEIYFSVEDSGIGIAEQDAKSIFLPFVQADASSQRRHDGTGLGLTISRRLVELMNGSIGFTSQLRVGSTFWFQLPLSRAPKVTHQQEPAEPLRLRPRRLSVLVAEDHPINQKVLVRMLQILGHKVEVACDGLEALAKHRRAKFDLILMDFHMPKLDGLSAARRIRQMKGAKGQITIVALTADVLKGTRERCLEAGMDSYLCKPVPQKGLAAVLNRVRGLISNAKPRDSAATPVRLTKTLDLKAIALLDKLNQPGSSDLVVELMDDFIKRAPGHISKIEADIQHKRYQAVSESCHSLKSFSAAVGAHLVSARAAKLELAALKRQPAPLTRDFNKMNQLFRQTLTQMEIFIQQRRHPAS